MTGAPRRWMKVNPKDALKGAHQLISYFRPKSRKEPTYAEWTTGLLLAERWLALIRHPAPSSEDLRRLAPDADAVGKNVGSGMEDLRIRIAAWTSGKLWEKGRKR